MQQKKNKKKTARSLKVENYKRNKDVLELNTAC